MTYRHFKKKYQKLIFFVFLGMLPFAANSTTEEIIGEKRMEVAMRMIGHEVLMCMGDTESRIMPIEKVDQQYNPESYRIPFELEFGFDPDDIVSIIERVMTQNEISNGYLVEVEQCYTKEVVHSFEIRNGTKPDMIPCRGRLLPEDCYSLIITILDVSSDPNPLAAIYDPFSIDIVPPSDALSTDSSPLMSSETKESTLFKSPFLLLPLLFLMGFISYYLKKKNSSLPNSPVVDTDPNLILIGASQFDKRNMALSFEDKKVELSFKESELLSLLHTSANAPIEREVLLQRVWGDEGDYVGRTLDVFISKLRKKLAADASVKIVNIRGIGYKLVMDVPK